jgi:hypothetical protein
LVSAALSIISIIIESITKITEGETNSEPLSGSHSASPRAFYQLVPFAESPPLPQQKGLDTAAPVLKELSKLTNWLYTANFSTRFAVFFYFWSE